MAFKKQNQERGKGDQPKNSLSTIKNKLMTGAEVGRGMGKQVKGMKTHLS